MVFVNRCFMSVRSPLRWLVVAELLCVTRDSQRRRRFDGVALDGGLDARLDADENVLDQDRGDQDHADHADLGGAVDAGEAEAVANVEHDQDRQRHAGHPPGSPEDRDAAEQHDRDHLEFEAVGQITAGGAESSSEEDPGQTGDERRRRRTARCVRRPP